MHAIDWCDKHKTMFNLVDLASPAITNKFVNISGGLRPRGVYSSVTNYVLGDAVSYDGSSYILYVASATDVLPTDEDYWMLMARGVAL